MSSTSDLSAALAQAAQELGLALDARQESAISAYMAQIQKWNKTYNLTALRKPEQILVQHVLDSLSAVNPIRRFLAARPAKEAVIVDVGSGAGLPGTMLAVMHPEWQVYCVDAVEKKMAFVRQMASVLGLPNLHAVHGRVEQLPPYEADVVVSRAFASLPDFVQLASRHVASDGVILAMKGRAPQDEIDGLHEAQSQWRMESIEPLHVPLLDAQRCLVWIGRQGNS